MVSYMVVYTQCVLFYVFRGYFESFVLAKTFSGIFIFRFSKMYVSHHPVDLDCKWFIRNLIFLVIMRALTTREGESKGRVEWRKANKNG